MKKIILIIAASLIVLAGGLGLYLHFTKSRDFTPLITRKLQQLVEESSDGLYRLELDSMDIDVLQSVVVLHHAQLVPDSARLQQLVQEQRAPDDIYRLSVKQVHLDGISPADLLDKKHISLNTLHIKQPIVEIFHQKRGMRPLDTTTVYKKISRQLNSFQLGELRLDHVQLTYYDIDQGNQRVRLPELSCELKNILLDASTQHDTTRFLFAKDARLLLNNYQQITKDNLYRFHIDSLTLSATEKTLYLQGVSLKPLYKKEDFSKKLRYRKDRYDLQADAVTIKNIDWWSLLLNQGILADSAFVTNGDMEIYSDKRLPPSGEQKTGSYPHQKLTITAFPIYLKNIRVRNTNVYYKEFNVLSGKIGTVAFRHAGGDITNITNIPEKIHGNNWMQVNAQAAFMDAGDLEAQFRFNLQQAAEGIFTISAHLGEMDARALNDATVPLALYHIKTGHIRQFSLQLEGNNTNAKAHTSVTYNDLKVAVLKKDKDGNTHAKGLASFIANNFLLASSSPDNGKRPIQQQVSYIKKPQQTFWGLIWKTILEGIKPSIKGE